MSALGELGRRLHMLAQRRRWRRELEEEMLLHRALRGDDRRFGNELNLRERSQAQWGWTWLETWLQDGRHGLRLLARTPLITALALVSLALGIGATTALFSLADAVIWRPLPVAHPEQIVQLTNNSEGPDWPAFSNPYWEQVRNAKGLFAGAFATGNASLRLPGLPRRFQALWVSGGYFNVLGLHPERGRLLSPGDDDRGCPAVADISAAFWRSHYGGAASAVGAMLQLSGHDFQIVGVTPPGFFGTDVGDGFDAALPLCTEALVRGKDSLLGRKNGGFLELFARLAPHESPAQAEARLEAARPLLAAGVPADERATWRVTLHGAANGWSGLRLEQGLALEILLGVAGLVWLLACANLAALMRARAEARRPEIAVRAALGAGRARLLRQLLTESLLLATGGALLGWALAAWACQAAVRFWSYSPHYPLRLNLAPDSRVLGFAIVMTLATALLVGLAPALCASDANLAAAAQRRSTVALGWRLTAIQMALALVLAAGAGLFARSLARLTGPAKGFDSDNVALVEPAAYATPAEAENPGAALRRRALLARLRALAGVTVAAASQNLPVQRSSWAVKLARAIPPSPARMVWANAISPGYFAALRQPLLAGRDFGDADTGAPVIILNLAAARVFFPHGHALGQTMSSADYGYKSAGARVVGIVADAKYLDLRRAPPPEVYFPLHAQSYAWAWFELRSPLPPATLERQARAVLGREAQLTTYTSLMDAGIKPEILLARLAELFGGLALALAGLGLYGVTAYRATRRRREFGIRMTLGADAAAIAAGVLREAAGALAAGLAAGLLLAWALTQTLRAALGKLLFDISARDLSTWLAAAAALAATAALAAWLPARRAAHAEPLAALREE